MNQENFVVDKKGRKIAVQIPIRIYEQLISDSEELDEIKEYRIAKKHKGEAIPFEQAFREIQEEKLWLNSISKNPAFDFLSEPSEDNYSQKDGEAINDKNAN